MNPIPSLFQHPWQIFKLTDQAAASLAIENSLIRYLPQQHQQAPQRDKQIILHWYPIPQPSILLGAKDTRLPHIQEGVTFLHEQGYQVVVRPHGGLAIVCDPGVINFSIVQDMDNHSLSIDEAYQQFIDLIQVLFQPYGLNIDAYEMERSYCPGKFDIIVNGQKIGGTAQRRFKKGITTAAYLSIDGQQDQRAMLLKDFYRISGADVTYPDIDIHCMTTLSDQLKRPISCQDFYRDMVNTLAHYTQVSVVDNMPDDLVTPYQAMLAHIEDRTQSIHLND